MLGDGPDADAFAQVYGLSGEPNFEGGRYVLHEPRSRVEQAHEITVPARKHDLLTPDIHRAPIAEYQPERHEGAGIQQGTQVVGGKHGLGLLCLQFTECP